MATEPEAPDLPTAGWTRAGLVGERMSRLGAVIQQAIVYQYGRDERCGASAFRLVPVVGAVMGRGLAFARHPPTPA